MAYLQIPWRAGIVMADGKILVFTKAPIPGQVKTRLAADIGNAKACEIHKQLVIRTLETVSNSNIPQQELWCSPNGEDPFLREQATYFNCVIQRQQGDDLGQRMAHAFEHALRDAPWAILIGTDCPALTAEDLNQVADLLASGASNVFGPALDGGYYLVGLSQFIPEIFRDVAWGTSQVMNTTRDKVGQLGLPSKEINAYRDVDYLSDILEYRDLFDF